MTNSLRTPFEAPLVELEACPSTNTYAFDLAKKGAQHGTIVYTNKQTAGKGRGHKHWTTPKDSLAFSLIARLDVPIEKAFRVTFLTALSLVETLQSEDVPALVKWPNDVLVQGKKVAGILTELSCTNQAADFAVIGIGLNLVRDPTLDDSPDLKHAGFLSDSKKSVIKEELLYNILNRLKLHLELVKDEQHWQEVLKKIRHLSATLRHTVSVKDGQKLLRGFAREIQHDGSLILEDQKGSVFKIYAGDVLFT